MKHRNPHLIEHMDRPDCDQDRLRNTYRLFPLVNRVFSRWNGIYAREIRPMLTDPTKTYTLLDVGSGLMDNSLFLMSLAKKDGFRIKITGLDPSPVVRHMLAASGSELDFICGYLDAQPIESSYDFIISNHLLHHLDEDQLQSLLRDVAHRTRIKAIMNDIHRSPVAYIGFTLITFPLHFRSYIFQDGRLSIRKSFKPKELEQLVSKEWQVKSLFPYRSVLVYERP